MTARGIDHVGVTVPDLEQAMEFFTRVLGAQKLYDTLPRSDGPKGGPQVEQYLGVPHGTVQVACAMLRLPDGPGLELFEFAGPQQNQPVRPCDLGWQHLGVYVDDLEAAMGKVRDAGGTVLAQPRPLPGPEAGEHNRFVYCHTPWGSTLELLTYPDPQPYEKHTAARRWRPVQ